MKKLLATILAILSIACIFCGCGEDTSNESSSPEYNGSTVEPPTKDIAYPTFSESIKFVQEEFPEYKDYIVCPESLGNVVLQKNGILVGVYYENGKFDKIVSKNSDFASAFKVISDFYSEIMDYNLTATKLEENMKVKTQMPNWTSYTYEDSGLSYLITVGSGYVQIQVE